MRRLLLASLMAGALTACTDAPKPTDPLRRATGTPPRYGAFPGSNGKIVFTSTRDGGGIFVMDADGANVQKLTSTFGTNCSWSADGAKIAFSAFVGTEADGNVEIFVMNADGTGQTQVTTAAGNDFGPSWSPDGTKIAFYSDRSGNNEIYVMNADGSSVVNLTNNAADDRSPAWSPDGARIAFGTGRDGAGEIYVMNADGSNPTDLTNNPSNEYDPTWSPDGSKIVFGRETPLNEIAVMNADGSGQTLITDDPGGAALPSWSPDGTKIVFVSGRDGNNEIYVMNSDGTEQTRLTNEPGSDTGPDWQPIPGAAPSADLSLLMQAAAQKVAKTVQYTIAVRNLGPDAAAGVTLIDALPAEARFLAVNPTQGTCTTPAAGSSGTVRCSAGTLASGAKVTVQITVKMFPPNSHPNNTASVTSTTADPNPANNSATVQAP
jgi:uncharacterized repeat protein (TIGR01451 family)